MNDSVTSIDPAIPAVRTARGTAIVLSALSVVTLGFALTVGGDIEESLKSETLALAVLAIWCVSGITAAIAAIVDAYIRPEGEILGIVVSVAATVFALLALIVVVALLFTVGSSFTESNS